MKRFPYIFLGTMKVVNLKFSTHMDNGLMYYVYRNQGQGLIILGVTDFDRLYYLPLMKTFLYRFLRNYESCEVEIR